MKRIKENRKLKQYERNQNGKKMQHKNKILS